MMQKLWCDIGTSLKAVRARLVSAAALEPIGVGTSTYFECMLGQPIGKITGPHALVTQNAMSAFQSFQHSLMVKPFPQKACSVAAEPADSETVTGPSNAIAMVVTMHLLFCWLSSL